ncbi:positive regulator of purine utilization [Ophiocordyceps camponoti-floridani]|uniref:Positive regulator of purine utilization n=1 Tax=Ophiocordyceps camponoti-floridani TaxID=2030778 RepID=A0A8H4Q689_9HYPO|nr:positive regulator of purine utilization [Ophiocordyceps camponoti-floridani]
MPSQTAAKRRKVQDSQETSFRNVSACNRCRLRKNRCDQKLPSCASCDKVGVACVGYDPITKKEIPRSYLFYLEGRVRVLEGILRENDVAFPPAGDLEACSREEMREVRTGATGVPFTRMHLSPSPSNNNITTMRESFFGLRTKPTMKPAPFPDRSSGLKLATLYFEHANPQIPILHRGEFLRVLARAYADEGGTMSARELYLVNMVFAIGSGVIVKMDDVGTVRPEEFHASAMVHLESSLSFRGGGLEVLQAVLLLANFALLRPVPPGLWYITGVAVRLAVDLGLHREDGGDAGPGSEPRRAWMRDMRRRLWWCTYSLDRLVSTCVGRPPGISDQDITTQLPSLVDDDGITPLGLVSELGPSYKRVAHHYFRLRMLQSEMLQVQLSSHRQRDDGLPCPLLVRFGSFSDWRRHMHDRLLEWKASAPTRRDTGVAFETDFLELNYWQAVVMLYRRSLSVPIVFEGEYNTSDEVDGPNMMMMDEGDDDVYVKVAEAGQRIVRIYRQLHLGGLVSYTYLSTHHLFMAGISYLYAIWHSPVVRARLTLDDVDFTVLAAKSVFTDLMDKCPPAEMCRDALDRTAKATISMASSSGGFGTAMRRHVPKEASSFPDPAAQLGYGDAGVDATGLHPDLCFDGQPFDAFFFGGGANM